ncbi:MAG TPA: plastocyanin/azurin family copper-binding protein [Candidatus Nitrosocosmicus sp.]|nr:plastocyanin/azurin family copper-binding protein [Candidatus Nitrosocosmicus sp.]
MTLSLPLRILSVAIKISEIKVMSFCIKIIIYYQDHFASIKDINRGDLIHFVVNMADKTDKIAFYGIIGLAVLTGIITYYAFSAVSPAPGIVDSIYRQDLPAAPEQATASGAAGGGGAAEEAIDESAFANKVEVKILAGSSTQGNPDYEPDAATATSDALVTWVNEDTVPHTATSGSGPQDPESAQLFDTSIIMAGATASVPAEQMGAGDHTYYCTVHPFMQGTIAVT